MKDLTSIQRIDCLHPKIREEVKLLIAKAEAIISPDLTIRIVQGLRTIKEQNKLYAQGRTAPGNIVTNAPGGSSYHNYGLAIDFAFLLKNKSISWNDKKDFDGDKIADWMEVVKVFKNAGYTWGGDFKSIKDNPHFEKTFHCNWRLLLDMYNKKEFIKGTEYVNI